MLRSFPWNKNQMNMRSEKGWEVRLGRCFLEDTKSQITEINSRNIVTSYSK